MAWFALARILFVAAVAYAAAILLPLPVGMPANVVFALALAGLVVVFESRLRETAATRVFGALIGCFVGLGIAHLITTGLFWADNGDRRVEFLHSFMLIVLPYLGLSLGAKYGEWLEPARLIDAVPRRRPAAPLQDPRHQRHHRRPHRRRLRDRLCRRHARDSAVRAEGAAARRRFRRLAEAQPRPPRPRHPAEDSEDGRHRSHHLRHRFSGGQGSRSQADRARRARCRERSSPTTST